MSCMGLVDEPVGDTWFCLKCKPVKRQSVKKMAGAGGEGANDTFCFVCQEGGKLMYCETCPRSFHGKCIDIGVVNPDIIWSCPCCHGIDPTRKGTTVHTKTERKAHLAQLQKLVRVQNRTANRNKTAFLWENRELIAPFVTPQQLLKLKREAEKMGVAKMSKEVAREQRAQQGRIGKFLNNKNKKRGGKKHSSSSSTSGYSSNDDFDSSSNSDSSNSGSESDDESSSNNSSDSTNSSSSMVASSSDGIKPFRRRNINKRQAMNNTTPAVVRNSLSRQEEAKRNRALRVKRICGESSSSGDEGEGIKKINLLNPLKRKLAKTENENQKGTIDLDFSDYIYVPKKNTIKKEEKIKVDENEEIAEALKQKKIDSMEENDDDNIFIAPSRKKTRLLSDSSDDEAESNSKKEASKSSKSDLTENIPMDVEKTETTSPSQSPLKYEDEITTKEEMEEAIPNQVFLPVPTLPDIGSIPLTLAPHPESGFQPTELVTQMAEAAAVATEVKSADKAQQPIVIGAVDVSKEYAKKARVGDKEVPCRWRAGLKGLRNGEVKSRDASKNSRLVAEGIKLKAYQELGVDWLVDSFFNKSGAILADEMGLGKTIQTLAFLSYLKVVEGITGPYLVVVPLSTVGNWVREAKRFTPHLKVTKICGSASERDFQLLNQDAIFGYFDIYITTYETLKTEEKFFADDHLWQVCVLDEAHRIKNEKGSVRHSLDRVRCNMRLLLTGTPLQNSLKELFTLINFLFPGLMDGSRIFEDAFHENPQQKAAAARSRAQSTTPAALKRAIAEAEADAEVRKLMEADKLDSNVANKTVELLSKLMLRRTKELVVALPPKTVHEVWLPLAPRSLMWYKKMLELTSVTDSGIALKALVNLITTLRLHCLHPRANGARSTSTERMEYIIRELFSRIDSIGANDDAEAMIEAIVRDAKDDRALVGRPHVMASSKLVFLDKLLKQLHSQNYTFCSSYRRIWRMGTEARALRRLELFLKTLESVAFPDKRGRDTDNRFLTSDKAMTSKKMKDGDPALQQIFNDFKSARSHLEDMLNAKARVVSKKTKTKDEKDDTINNASSAVAIKDTAQAEAEEELKQKREAAQVRYNHCLQSVLSSLNLSSDAIEEAEFDLSEIHEEDVNLLVETIKPFTGESQSKTRGIVTQIEGKTVIAELPEDDGEDDEDEETRTDDGDIEMNGEDKNKNKIPKTTIAPSNPVLQQQSSSTTVAVAKEKHQHYLPHKVLVFSQFQLVLDELERYLKWRGFSYNRLDGSTNRIIRELDIRDFNRTEDNTFIYLISTRAGGLGINLVSANHVILFDEDWNPFVDLQAIDRAHRIGQKREVNVFKLVTEWTVEERMAFRRDQKLRLDKLIVTTHNAGCEQQQTNAPIADSDEAEQDANTKDGQNAVLSPDEIRRLLTHGASVLIAQTDNDSENRMKALPSLNSHLVREHLPLPDEESVRAQVVADVEEEEMSSEKVLMKPEDLLVAPPNEDDETANEEMNNNTSSVDIKEAVAIKVEEQDEYRSGNGIMPMRRQRIKPKVFEIVQEAKESTSWRDKKCLSVCLMCDERVKTFDAESVTAEKLGEGQVGVRCSKCPQVFHGSCLSKEGLSYTKSRSLSCPCHQCSSCGRAASLAGGHLLHCLDCIEALCYDCFPDDHKRVLPEEGFFDMMLRMGWLQYSSPERYITYRCNSCRARNEIRRRRDLRVEERLAEIRAQEETRKKQKAKAAKHNSSIDNKGHASGVSGGKQSQRSILEMFALKNDFDAAIEHYDKNDDINLSRTVERVTKTNVDARQGRLQEIIDISKMLKSEFNSSFPENLIEALKNKIASQKASTKAAKQAATTNSSDTPIAMMDTPSVGGKAAAKVAKASDWVSGLPDTWISFCSNCHLPGHISKVCPFPLFSSIKVLKDGDGADGNASLGKRVVCCSACLNPGHMKLICPNQDTNAEELALTLDIIYESLREIANLIINDVDFVCNLDPSNNKEIPGVSVNDNGLKYVIVDAEAMKNKYISIINNSFTAIVKPLISIICKPVVVLPENIANDNGSITDTTKTTIKKTTASNKPSASDSSTPNSLTAAAKAKSRPAKTLTVSGGDDVSDLVLVKPDGTPMDLETLSLRIDKLPQFLIAQSTVKDMYEPRLNCGFALPDGVHLNETDLKSHVTAGHNLIFTYLGNVQVVRGLGKTATGKKENTQGPGGDTGGEGVKHDEDEEMNGT